MRGTNFLRNNLILWTRAAEAPLAIPIHRCGAGCFDSRRRVNSDGWVAMSEPGAIATGSNIQLRRNHATVFLSPAKAGFENQKGGRDPRVTLAALAQAPHAGARVGTPPGPTLCRRSAAR